MLQGRQKSVTVDVADRIITLSAGPHIFDAIYGAKVNQLAAQLLGEPV